MSNSGRVIQSAYVRGMGAQPGMMHRVISHVLQPVSKAMRTPAALSWLGVVLAGVLGFAVAVEPFYISIGFGCIAAAVLTFRYPVPAVLLVGALAQEINPNSLEQKDTAVGIGHQVYFTSVAGLPALLLLSAIAGVSIAGRCKAEGIDWKACFRPAPAKALIGIGIVAALLSAWHTGNVGGSIARDARFAILAVLGIMVGVYAVSSTQRRNTVRLLRASVAILGVGGVLIIATGTYLRTSTGQQMAYYDGATAALAGAYLVGSFLSPHHTRRDVIFDVLAAITLALSFRRNVWLAALVAAVVLLLLQRRRIIRGFRVVVSACAAFLGVNLFFPEFYVQITTHMQSGIDTLLGRSSEVSTTGHVDDVFYGYDAALEAPLLGYGPLQQRIPGLFNQSGPLYVHNEFLQLWLKYGLIPVGLLIVFLVTSIWTGLWVLGKNRDEPFPGSGLLTGWSTALLLMLPVSLMTAPYISTTQRWPLLVGVAVGILMAGRIEISTRSTNATSELSNVHGTRGLVPVRR